MAGREDVFQRQMNEGHSAAWDQDWQRAAEAYRAALAEFPDRPGALTSLALALYQLQRYEDALGIYRRVSALTPDDPIPFEKIAELSERLGNLKDAVEAAMHAAELYLKNRDVDKAIQNWVRVITLHPDHVLAHSRLALAHERLGHPQQAVVEYLAVASLVQRSGNLEKTAELVEKARQLLPDSPEVKQALQLLRANQLLPRPVRPKGGTGPIRMAQVRQLEPARQAVSGKDPVAEARQKALTALADVLFEYSDESGEAQARRGLQAIMRGTGQLSLQKSEQTRVVMHLGQAIDAQTNNQEAQAAEELERALEAGFRHPALYFDLGMLRARGDRLESALRYLQHAVKHADYALAARLLMGQVLRRMNRLTDASVEYLEALKLADGMVVPPEQADAVRQLYEPLVEAQARQTDEDALNRLCDNIQGLLLRPDWQASLARAREQLPRSDGGLPLPLAEILIQAQSSQVLDAIHSVHQLARAGHLRSAMDQAFEALTHAPTYLPLHTLIGDLLVREGRVQDAIAKYTVVAQAYSVRGETAQSTQMLRRVIQLAPMDLAARTRLIEQLAARGQVNEAIAEYMELADLYYRLAELDMARKTYTTALRLSQQGNADRSWSVRILQRMADIDLQRLDWRQAVRVFEQIRTLRPDDGAVRRQLVELNLRLGQPQQAMAELEAYLSLLEGAGRGAEALTFLEEMVRDNPGQGFLMRALAEQYRRAGRLEEAVAQLDAAGEAALQAGDTEGAIAAISMILSINPPNASEYRKLLAQLQARS